MEDQARAIGSDIISGKIHNIDSLLLSEKDQKEVAPIVDRFLESWAQKDAAQSDEEWLYEKMKEELPEKSDEEIQQICLEIHKGVLEYDKNRKELDEACKQGMSKESWFRNKVEEAAVGYSAAEYGSYLQEIDDTLRRCNEDLSKVILTKSGHINMNPNLDGFLAEQKSVNSFNMNAALRNSPYRAEVSGPSATGYGKNSVDVYMRDIKKSGNNIIQKYQVKYGKDAKHTIEYLKKGDYHNQRILIPKGQKREVKNWLSKGRSVNDHLEAPDGTKSDPFTKKQMQRLRERVQSGKKPVEVSWNSYKIKDVALNLGGEVVRASAVNAAMVGMASIASDWFNGRKINWGKAAKAALQTGKNSGIRYGLAGVLKVAAERGMIPALRTIPSKYLGGIACVGFENTQILYQFATGKISGSVALDRFGRTNISAAAGWLGAKVGAGLGMLLPVVGTTIGMQLGRIMGYMIGSSVGKLIYQGGKKIVSVATSFLSKCKRTATNLLRTGVNKIADWIGC